MLQYAKHRFHFRGVSFRIPDDFFLDSVPDVKSGNRVLLVAPDRNYSVEIRIEEDTDGSEFELQTEIEDLAPKMVHSIAPIAINGLSGFHATYRNRRSQGYAVWFDLNNGSDCLNIVVSTQGNIENIDTAAIIIDIDPRPET